MLLEAGEVEINKEIFLLLRKEVDIISEEKLFSQEIERCEDETALPCHRLAGRSDKIMDDGVEKN